MKKLLSVLFVFLFSINLLTSQDYGYTFGKKDGKKFKDISDYVLVTYGLTDPIKITPVDPSMLKPGSIGNYSRAFEGKKAYILISNKQPKHIQNIIVCHEYIHHMVATRRIDVSKYGDEYFASLVSALWYFAYDKEITEIKYPGVGGGSDYVFYSSKYDEYLKIFFSIL